MPVTIEDVRNAFEAGDPILAGYLTQQLQRERLSTIAQAPPTLPSFPVVPTPKPPTPPRPTRPTLINTQRPPADTQVTVSAAEKPVRLCYGHVRIGGEIIWVGKTSGAWVFQVRWCLGEVNSFLAVELEDGSLPAGSTITNYFGTTSQGVDSTLAALIAGYTDTLIISVGGHNHGIAYSVITIPYAVMPGSINFTAELEAKKVYDPRSSTTVYSTNPSLHLRDFLIQPIYGMEWNIFSASVETAADANDDLVGGDKRRESGMIIETPQDSRAWIEALSGAAAVFLVVENGSVKMVPNRPAASAGTLDMSDEIVAGSWAYQPMSQRNYPTVVHVRYTDTSTTPWSEHTATAKAAGVDAGTTPYRVSRLIMPWIQSHEQAYREAVEYLNGNALPSFNCAWIGSDKHYTLERGDRYTLSNIPSVTGTKEVRILRNELVKQSNGSYLFKITAREYLAGEYSNDVVSGPAAVDPDLPDPFDPTAVTDVAVAEAPWIDLSGHYQTTLETTWTGVDHAHVRGYRVLISTSAGANVINEEMILHRGDGVAHATTSPPVETGVLHTVQIWTISTIGAVSAADSDTITPVGDALPAPGSPTGLSTAERVWFDDNGNAHSVIEITWTGISDQWARSYKVEVFKAADLIAEAVIPNLGAVSHYYTTGPVEIGIHLCQVTTINVEGDFSITAQDTVTPTGDILPPDNVTGLTATEYWGRVDVEWDNVLELGDIGYRIKRGTQAQSWATADESDETIYMNPADYAETITRWSDHDVARGDKTYFVKGIDRQGDESTTAAEIDITIESSKGSFKDQNPKIPQYPTDQGQIIFADGTQIGTWISSTSLMGGMWNDTLTTTAWETVLTKTGAGVLRFFAIAAENATSNAGYYYGARVTIDGKQIINTTEIEAIATFGAENGIVPVGAIMFDGSGDIVAVDSDYLPFNESLLIECIRSNANITVRPVYHYYETKIESPASRPSIPSNVSYVGEIGIAAGVTFFNIHHYFDTHEAYTGLIVGRIVASTAWTTILDVTSESGVLEFCCTAFENVSGTNQTGSYRITLDGDVISTSGQTIGNGDEAGFMSAGNITFDANDALSDIDYDYFPFDSSLKIEAKTTSTSMNVAVAYMYHLT